MSADKINFLRTELLLLLEKVNADAKARWGKMDAQQMIEHLAYFFDMSAGKIQTTLVTPEEHLPKYRDFLYSDKEFRENTKAPESIIPVEPLPAQLPSLIDAMEKLKLSIDGFLEHFSMEPGAKTLHPVFGWLSFEDWLMLHYKHVNHHLRQFTA